MNNQQLRRSVQSIGMACFLKHYDLLTDQTVSNEKAIHFLMKNEKYSETGSKTRVSQAKRLVRENRVKDALKYISKSKKLDSIWVKKAQSLLAE